MELNWRSRSLWIWIALSACWILLTAVMAYRNVWVPHIKDVLDYQTCVIDHGTAACSNGLPFEESGPHLPNLYVPYIILGVVGPLAMLFAGLGLAWIREGSKTEPGDPEL